MLASKLLLACGSVVVAATVYITAQPEPNTSAGAHPASVEAAEVVSWPHCVYNMDYVNNWKLIGLWEDVEDSITEGLKRAVGEGPHSVRITLSIEAEAREHGLKPGSIVGEWGADSLRIENNDSADPFSPAWVGVDNHWSLYGWSGSALAPTVYNWAFVVNYKAGDEDCWQEAVAVPTGTPPRGPGNDPPNVGPGDKYQVCASETAIHDCKIKVELSTGRCWEHTVECKDDDDEEDAGYWHHDVSAEEFIVTGTRESFPCPE